MFFSAATGFSACSALSSPSSFMRRARRRRNRRPRHLPPMTLPPCASWFLICNSRCKCCTASCASCKRRSPISHASSIRCRCGLRRRRRRSAPICRNIFRRPQALPPKPPRRPTTGNCPTLTTSSRLRPKPPQAQRRPSLSDRPNPTPFPFLPTTTLSSPDANRRRVRVPRRNRPSPQTIRTTPRLRRSPPSSAKTCC